VPLAKVAFDGMLVFTLLAAATPPARPQNDADICVFTLYITRFQSDLADVRIDLSTTFAITCAVLLLFTEVGTPEDVMTLLRGVPRGDQRGIIVRYSGTLEDTRATGSW